MDRSPRESVEIKVNSNIVSVSVLSEVAKIDRSFRGVMGVPMRFFEVLLGDVAFPSMFEDDIGFVG